MKCPRCGLINPSIAQRCDCGYDFERRTVEKSYVTPKIHDGRDVSAYVRNVFVLAVVAQFLGFLPNAVMQGHDIGAELIIRVVWLVVALVLYKALTDGRSWAWVLLIIWTIPFGLALLTRKVRDYVGQT